MITLDSLTPTHRIVNLIASIEAFRGSWRALQNMPPEQLTQLRRVATIESIGSSTRIEGSQLSNNDVGKLLQRQSITSLPTRDEQEVMGYADAMELIFDNWRAMPLTESTIRQLHRALLAHRPQDDWHRGDYKTSPNSVAAFGADGQVIGIVLDTADPIDTPRLITELVTWTNRELEEATHHHILVVGAFVVTFLTIHPFQDGNGRLSRVLTTLLLLRNSFGYVPYSSLERVIEESTSDYYLSLRQTQQTLATEAPNWTPWLEYFLRALRSQAMHLQAQAERFLDVPWNSNPLEHQLVEIVRLQPHTTMADLVDASGANRNTLKVRVRALVAAGKIVQHGTGRRTWYSVP